jgi:periplasmic divalent cation tolerance protein
MLMIGWTTTDTRERAETLAQGLVAARLAACVQIDGPIASHYVWQGRPERAEEFRLTVKFVSGQASEVERWLLAHHSYETPQWYAVRAETVTEKYLSWAKSNLYSSPF